MPVSPSAATGSGSSSPSRAEGVSGKPPGSLRVFQDATAASIVTKASVQSPHRGQAITQSGETAPAAAGPATGGCPHLRQSLNASIGSPKPNITGRF